jgi:Transposase DDE domain
MGIDSECYLFGKLQCNYQEAFPHLISRRQYNDRRKQLFYLQEKARDRMSAKLNEVTEVYAIDSMPLEICKMARMERNKMGKDHEYTKPDKGFCAAQNKYYYGYKLHSVCSASGVIQSLNLTRASVHDVHYLKDIKHSFSDCIITGDRGYISKELKETLWVEKRINLEVPYRSNQKDKKPGLYILRKIRKRIETVFSQLCDQFMIQRNYAKSFPGYKTRILAKISGMTTLQYINKFIRDKPIGQVKYAFS